MFLERISTLSVVCVVLLLLAEPLPVISTLEVNSVLDSSSAVSSQSYNENCSFPDGRDEGNLNSVGYSVDTRPRIINTLDGGFAIVWSANAPENCILFTRFKSPEEVITVEGVVSIDVVHPLTNPSVATLAADEASLAFSWTQDLSNDSSSDAKSVVQFSIRNASSIKCPAARIGSSALNYEGYSSVVGLEGGRIVVTWLSYNSSLDGDSIIFFSILDAQCNFLENRKHVLNITQLYRAFPAVAALHGGDFIVIFDRIVQSVSIISAQRFSSDGVAVGQVFEIGGGKYGSQTSPTVATLNDGGYVVAYLQPTTKIFVQVFSSDGSARGGEILVNEPLLFDVQSPFVSPIQHGGFISLWTCDYETHAIRGRIFDSYDAAGGPQLGINLETSGSQRYPCASAHSNTEFNVVWEATLSKSQHNVRIRDFECSGAHLSSSQSQSQSQNGSASTPSSSSHTPSPPGPSIGNLISATLTIAITSIVFVLIIVLAFVVILVAVVAIMFIMRLIHSLGDSTGGSGLPDYSNLDADGEKDRSYVPPNAIQGELEL